MYYIPVSEGLLHDNHEGRMGNALWLYLQLVNRMTNITKEGLSVVSGGKPLKIEEHSIKKRGNRKKSPRRVFDGEKASVWIVQSEGQVVRRELKLGLSRPGWAAPRARDGRWRGVLGGTLPRR